MALVVLGARGRLGSLVLAEASAHKLEARGVGRGEAHALASTLAGATCVIDVTTAGSTVAHAAACVAARVPLVVATTGMSPDDNRSLEDAARSIPVLVAANLSVSAHVAARLVREAARHLMDADAEVVEVHHKKKKDAPSGTALMLARAVVEGRGTGEIKRARDGHAPRVAGEIGVSAVRGGDVVGEHTVLFLGDGEHVEIVHRVTDRAVFARGALAAAQFVTGRPAGWFTMADVIGR